MDSRELKGRTKVFALCVLKFVDLLPKNKTTDVLGNQLLRSATSVGANYRSACRARSRAEFVSKITIVEEEIDESAYWLELLKESETAAGDELVALLREADELTAIFTAAGRTAKRRRQPVE